MVPAGMNWEEAWYGELDDAKGAIMLLSEDYFKSGVCVDELIASKLVAGHRLWFVIGLR